LRFRVIKLAVGLLCLAAGAAVGCEKTTGGTAIRPSAPRPSHPAEPAPVIVLPLPDGWASAAGGGDLRGKRPAGKVAVTAAQFCGYSSQLLTGTVPGAVDFADRITHIWTNTKAYLVAIHLEGPAGAPGFDAAKTTVMQQFAVVIP
jgi:hypothetical protein